MARISKKKAFLEAYKLCAGNLTRAAACAEMDRRRHHEWLKEDPEYAQEFAQAEREVAKSIEDEAIRRAVEGVERPLFHRGHIIMVPVTDELGRPIYDEEPILDLDGSIVKDENGAPKMKRVMRERPYLEREYSDSVLIQLLRGWMPEKYGAKVEHGGPGGGPIEVRVKYV